MTDTPIQRLRAPAKLWREFGEACEANGTDRSTVLRTYMRRYVAAWKGRHGHGVSSGDTPTGPGATAQEQPQREVDGSG